LNCKKADICNYKNNFFKNINKNKNEKKKKKKIPKFSEKSKFDKKIPQEIYRNHLKSECFNGR